MKVNRDRTLRLQHIRYVKPTSSWLIQQLSTIWDDGYVSVWWYDCQPKKYVMTLATMAKSRSHIGSEKRLYPGCMRTFHRENMSDCESPRFTERTSTNLGRSHRLPHVCTIMIYGKLGGYRLQETAAFIYIYICDELWIICDIWVSLMWILEKYDDITLKRGIANLGRSHRLPRVFNKFHQFP